MRYGQQKTKDRLPVNRHRQDNTAAINANAAIERVARPEIAADPTAAE